MPPSPCHLGLAALLLAVSPSLHAQDIVYGILGNQTTGAVSLFRVETDGIASVNYTSLYNMPGIDFGSAQAGTAASEGYQA
ncbi:MAG: hypothetical protein EOP87_12755 [Verrucomicrobiaceae bacterium]|nr:MAG: hypothetical protein EOP87_12755 [Verrucomicrobiaceae bacterium]